MQKENLAERMKRKTRENAIKASTGLPFPRISASMVRDYLTCEKLFYYRHVLRIRLPEKPITLVFGTAFHLGIEAWYEKKDPVEVFKKNFTIDKISHSKTNITLERDFKENLQHGIDLMQEWKKTALQIHSTYKIPIIGKSELKFNIRWKDPSNGEILQIPFVGVYDRVTGTGQILEFKTSKKKYTKEHVDTQVQADSYYMTYLMQKGTLPKNFFYIVFIKGRKKDPIQVLETVRTKSNCSQIFKTVKLILQAVKYKKEADYRYGTGFMHNYCDCKKIEQRLLL